jgi:hypothetical protein
MLVRYLLGATRRGSGMCPALRSRTTNCGAAVRSRDREPLCRTWERVRSLRPRFAAKSGRAIGPSRRDQFTSRPRSLPAGAVTRAGGWSACTWTWSSSTQRKRVDLASASTRSASATGADASTGALKSVPTAVPAHERSGAGEGRPRLPSRPGQGARFPHTRSRRRAAPRRDDHRLPITRWAPPRPLRRSRLSDMRSSSCRMLRPSRSARARTGRSDRVSSSSTRRLSTPSPRNDIYAFVFTRRV